MSIYFALGVGMYVGMAITNHKTFTGASSASLIRGVILCFLLWPIGLFLKLIEIGQEY